jgi:hypothetical protein
VVSPVWISAVVKSSMDSVFGGPAAGGPE